MPLSRRNFLADASALGMITALLPQLAAAQASAVQAAPSTDDLPHDSYDFWSGCFASGSPCGRACGNKGPLRGPAGRFPGPAAQTQCLHYDTDKKKLRYAS